MTISRSDRTENLELALRLMVENLPDDQPFAWQEFDGDLAPFTEISPTTWKALTRQGLVRPHTFNRYKLTAHGWITALKLLGQLRSPEMLEKAGRLSAALKRHVKGRHHDGLTTRQELAAGSALSEAFVYDAIEGHLLAELFGTLDASWAPDDQMRNYIEIPLDFGH